MSPTTLQERYEKSRSLGYKSRGPGMSMYPKIGGIFDSRDRSDDRRAEHQSKYIDERRTNLNDLYVRNRQTARFSGETRRPYAGGSAARVIEREGRPRSPIRILKDPLTPLRGRKKQLFKIIDSSSPAQRHSDDGRGTSGAGGGSQSYKQGLFNKLRDYLSNLNKVSDDDEAFNALKQSARDVLHIQVNEGRPKKVAFDERKAKVDKIDLDDDPVDEAIRSSDDMHTDIKLKERVATLRAMLESERRERLDLVRGHESKVSAMQEQHAAEIESLRQTIAELERKAEDAQGQRKQAHIKELEDELFKKHERFLITKKEQEAALQVEKDQLERARRELELKQKTVVPTSSIGLESIPNYHATNSVQSKAQKNEKIQILRERKDLTRAIRQLEAEYREVCSMTGTVFIPLMKAVSMSKYRSIIAKFEEYSSILRTLDANNTHHLLEIKSLFDLLRKNLVASSRKKTKKLEHLQLKTSAMHANLSKSLYSTHDVYSVYNRRHAVLNDLLSIQQLLLQLNSLTSEVQGKLRIGTHY